MSQEIQELFSYEGMSIRTIIKDGEPWFVAKDVATILGYKDTSYAIKTHCKGVGESPMPSNGGMQTMKVIPERDVYRLVMKSKLPNAEKFEEWVVGEVLPSIRKHGGYLTESKIEEALLNPDVLIQLATNLKEEQEKRKQAELIIVEKDAIIEIQKPKVEYFDDVLKPNVGLMNVTTIAKDLGTNAQQLNKILNFLGVIYKKGSTWFPYSDYQYLVKDGYCDYETFSKDGMHSINLKWTEKGRKFIIDLVKESGLLRLN